MQPCRFARSATALLAALLTFVNPWHGLAATFRPPAVPLVTFNPYLSIWSEADRLTDDGTRHWRRHEQRLVSLVRVDGETYRLMGSEPRSLAALPQVGLEVTPTRSI